MEVEDQATNPPPASHSSLADTEELHFDEEDHSLNDRDLSLLRQRSEASTTPIGAFMDCIIFIYARMQDDSLSGDAASVDIATNENLQKLAEIGRNLLKEPVSRIDVDTGRFQNVEGEGTNEDALAKFAKLLSQERKIRSQLINSSL
ncbi:hypothetical protein EZV62_014079 [Acer yangbiense]|uniref:Uncharacterized protein n=1 Tax=Acer yangbiense TaxID=1000413 RepID=A0A5C7HT77_9ROSI|nr:hypothetical protein EZV62_014079 [Acer yangbiense]